MGANRIALDRENNLYVAGRAGLRVLDAGGRLVRTWSTSGPAVCVAVGESGRVYVGLARRIEVYGRDGARITSWGEEGRGPGQFGLISGLAVSEPDVFVADSRNRCIHHFAMNGDFVGDIARRDPAAGEPGLQVPSPYLDCLTVPDGSLMLTDPGRRRIEHRTADGRRLGAWGVSGLAPGRFAGCCNPVRIAWVPGPAPGVVTAEKGTRRVQVFSPGGRLTGYIAPNRFARGTAPLDVAAASDGRLMVLDPEAGRVLVFRPRLPEGTAVPDEVKKSKASGKK